MSLFEIAPIRQSAEHAAITGRSIDKNPYEDPVRHAVWEELYLAYVEHHKLMEETQCSC